MGGGGMQEGFVARTISQVLEVSGGGGDGGVAVGLRGGDDWGGDPGAKPLAAGQSCGSIRQELDRLDARGTQGKVEAASQGKKLPPSDKADVDRYNELLNQYLGARCHV